MNTPDPVLHHLLIKSANPRELLVFATDATGKQTRIRLRRRQGRWLCDEHGTDPQCAHVRAITAWLTDHDPTTKENYR